VGSVILIWPGVEGLKGDRIVHSDAGMPPGRVVPALYPLEDGIGKFIAGLPRSRVEQFELHRSPERLHHGIVVAVTDSAHRREQAGGAEALPERPRRILGGFNWSSQRQFNSENIARSGALRRECSSRVFCGAAR
jgi:hypothetical protein